MTIFTRLRHTALSGSRALTGALALSLAVTSWTPALAQGAGPGQMGVPLTFADLAEAVSPSVVNITTATIVAERSDGMPFGPQGTPFDDLFRDFLDPPPGQGPGGPNNRRNQALGSGFVISADGLIVTNNHVIEGADEIMVEFFDGEMLEATLIGTDPATDIALLRVEAGEPLPFVPFGDSDASRVGDWVVAIGNPLGQGFSLSAGVISARGRALQGNYDDFIQTDAAINRGNSGGPLFNMAGEVIGVNTAILSPTGGSIGIGFAMSSNVVRNVVAQLQEFGETRRGWLGVRIQDVTPDIATSMALATARGALVTEVMPGPAEAAGMRNGDVIITFDGRDIADTRDLVRRVGDAGVGRAVDVVVLRAGQEQLLSVVLGRREEAEGTARTEDKPEDELGGLVLGMTLSPVTEDLRRQFNLPAGAAGLVVTAVDAASEAAEKGVQPGDLIVEAGQQPIASLADLEARVAEARDGGRDSVLLLLRRGGDPRFVALAVNP